MIAVVVGELAGAHAGALVRPVASDFSPVTPAMRRFDERAGRAMRAQCEQVGELPLGSAVITAGGDLDAEFIVHVAVRSGVENSTAAVVRRGLTNALRRLSDWGITTVAIAPLGTGAGNLDGEESAAAMVPLLVESLSRGQGVEAVAIVVEDGYQKAVFEAAVERADTGDGTRVEARS